MSWKWAIAANRTGGGFRGSPIRPDGRGTLFGGDSEFELGSLDGRARCLTITRAPPWISGRIATSIIDFWYTNKVHYLTVSIGKSRRNPRPLVHEGISLPLRHPLKYFSIGVQLDLHRPICSKCGGRGDGCTQWRPYQVAGRRRPLSPRRSSRLSCCIREMGGNPVASVASLK